MNKYCKCGERIWVEIEWNGLEHVEVFYDKEGRKITHCPGCGQRLFPKDLN